MYVLLPFRTLFWRNSVIMKVVQNGLIYPPAKFGNSLNMGYRVIHIPAVFQYRHCHNSKSGTYVVWTCIQLTIVCVNIFT